MPEVGPPSTPKLLLFGGGGAIGSAILQSALSRDWDVVATTRNSRTDLYPAETIRRRETWITIDPFSADFSASPLKSHGPYSAVCWAQGANANDSVYTVDADQHLALYKANCIYILATLKALLGADALKRPARLCVISSIWQNISRQDKLSYSMTKSALHGFLLSASTDLATQGHLINAVLPGALDTPMTITNLTRQQVEKISTATRFNRLPKIEDVVSLVLFLCSAENTGITGQFIAVDLGFSNVHLL